MAAMPARSSRALAARLREAELVLPSERGLQRRSKRRVRPQDTPREQMLEMQRARLLAAAVGAIDELGYARATVGHITARARVSRRTFYDLYAGRDECLLAAILEDVAAESRRSSRRRALHGLPWRERVRGGLWTILASSTASRRWRGCVWCSRCSRGQRGARSAAKSCSCGWPRCWTRAAGRARGGRGARR